MWQRQARELKIRSMRNSCSHSHLWLLSLEQYKGSTAAKFLAQYQMSAGNKNELPGFRTGASPSLNLRLSAKVNPHWPIKTFLIYIFPACLFHLSRNVKAKQKMVYSTQNNCNRYSYLLYACKYHSGYKLSSHTMTCNLQILLCVYIWVNAAWYSSGRKLIVEVTCRVLITPTNHLGEGLRWEPINVLPGCHRHGWVSAQKLWAVVS